jgi:hypothetical protein
MNKCCKKCRNDYEAVANDKTPGLFCLNKTCPCHSLEEEKPKRDVAKVKVIKAKMPQWFLDEEALKSFILSEKQKSREEGALEICICAAIRMEDGEIIRGHRHGDCFMSSRASKLRETQRGVNLAEQGFVTSFNRFVSREEGRKLQEAAGIPSTDKEGYRGKTLFSEDLY